MHKRRSYTDSVALQRQPLLQRLIIVHLQLAEMATGESLSESATDDERLENVLFYHSNNTDYDGPISASSDAAVKAEALYFAGLCQALYHLPQSLQTGPVNNNSNRISDHDNNTHYVTLDSCYLVYCRLEHGTYYSQVEDEDDDENSRNDNENIRSEQFQIIAAAQIGKNSEAVPESIEAYIRRSHTLFCLLRQGGIHTRLSRKRQAKRYSVNNTTTTGESVNGHTQFNQNKCIAYPELTELYTLRKQLRKLLDAVWKKDIISVAASNGNGSSFESIPDLERRINIVIPMLSIHALRKDLHVHYTALIMELNSPMATSVIGKCLVNLTPSVVATADGSHRHKSLPNSMRTESFAFLELNLYISDLLSLNYDASLYERKVSHHISGISLFYKNQLVQTHYRDKDSVALATYTTMLLYNYLAVFRYQLVQQQTSKPRAGLDSLPPELRSPTKPSRKRIVSNETQALVATAVTTDGFLPPPSLSLLSSLDDDEFDDNDFGVGISQEHDEAITSSFDEDTSIWAPRIYVKSDENNESVEVWRMCLLDKGSFSLVIYLTNTPVNMRLLTLFETKLSQAVSLAFPNEHRAETDTNTLGNRSVSHSESNDSDTADVVWNSIDCDIIHVDWLTYKTCVIPRMREDDKLAPTSNHTTAKKKFFNLKRNRHSNTSTPITSDLDCRYYLASTLPNEVVSALDCAMLQVRERRKVLINSVTNHNNISTEPFESFHLLSQHWLYVKADACYELYVILDASKHVTVVDVKKAVERIYANIVQNS